MIEDSVGAGTSTCSRVLLKIPESAVQVSDHTSPRGECQEIVCLTRKWPESVRPESVRPESVRPESVRPESVRPESVRNKHLEVRSP
jgi:hypothetical protein